MTEETAAPAAEPIVLNPDQQAAYDAIMAWLEARNPRYLNLTDPNARYRKPEHRLPPGAEEWFDDNPDDYFVLRGFAGVGKSLMLAELILDLSAKGWNIAATAPTNRAVGVIQDKVRAAAKSRVISATFKSLHSVCGLRMAENDDGTMSIASTGNPVLNQFDLLIVDEASMVDTKTLLRSIQVSREGCLVLFIGDPAQLPPVQEGVVAKVFKLPQGWMLDKVVRQAADNPLIAASMRIRERSRVNEILSAPSEHESQRIIQSLGPDDRVQASELMDFLPSDSFIRGTRQLREIALDLQRQGVDARILCYTNATVLNNNESIHFDLHPEAGNLMFVPGERVIVQSATKAENIETGKTVDLVTSEELVIADVELTLHPQYVNTKVYQLVMQDDLGNLVKVYTPKLMTAFKHQASKLFGEVNDINRVLGKNPSDRTLREKLNQARNAAWGYKNSFAEIRHCYSSTTHKAQGATVRIALIDLPDIMSMQGTFLYNAALYVALTRPTDRVYIAY